MPDQIELRRRTAQQRANEYVTARRKAGEKISRDDVQVVRIDVNKDGYLDKVWVDIRNLRALTTGQVLYDFEASVVAVDLAEVGGADDTDSIVKADIQAAFRAESARNPEIVATHLSVLEQSWELLANEKGKVPTGALLQVMATGLLPSGEEASPELLETARFYFFNPALLRQLDEGTGEAMDGIVSREDLKAVRAYNHEHPEVLASMVLNPPEESYGLSDEEMESSAWALQDVVLTTGDRYRYLIYPSDREARRMKLDYDDLALAMIEYATERAAGYPFEEENPPEHPEERHSYVYFTALALLNDPLAFEALDKAADRGGDADGLVSWADLTRIRPRKYVMPE